MTDETKFMLTVIVGVLVAAILTVGVATIVARYFGPATGGAAAILIVTCVAALAIRRAPRE